MAHHGKRQSHNETQGPISQSRYPYFIDNIHIHGHPQERAYCVQGAFSMWQADASLPVLHTHWVHLLYHRAKMPDSCFPSHPAVRTWSRATSGQWGLTGSLLGASGKDFPPGWKEDRRKSHLLLSHALDTVWTTGMLVTTAVVTDTNPNCCHWAINLPWNYLPLGFLLREKTQIPVVTISYYSHSVVCSWKHPGTQLSTYPIQTPCREGTASVLQGAASPSTLQHYLFLMLMIHLPQCYLIVLLTVSLPTIFLHSPLWTLVSFQRHLGLNHGSGFLIAAWPQANRNTSLSLH